METIPTVPTGTPTPAAPTRRTRRGAPAPDVPAEATRPPADSGRFGMFAVSELVESDQNSRKRFDPAGLEELTESIRQKGVLTPLLVRPVPAWSVMPTESGRVYEIAAGHRRFRAAKAAGLTQVPAVAREMTDVELLEVLVIENDQREDVHPLEEADGYRRLLMPGTGYDVARVAARVGRSVKYVYDRLKLLELVPAAQALFLDGKFTAGHAILLARLKPEDQKRAISSEAREGLFRSEHGLPFDLELEQQDAKDPYTSLKPVSVREFAGWIDDRVRFDPATVDPMLFPETAATLGKAAEETEKVVLITREYRASDPVREAGKERIFGEGAWERADGQADPYQYQRRLKPRECDRSVVGVVACGPGRGEAFRVCIDKERCAVHWSTWQKERKERQAAGVAGGGDRRGTEQAKWKLEQQKRQEEQARREAESQRWAKARPAILAALAETLKKAAVTPSGEMARLILARCKDNWQARNIQHEKYLPKGKTAEDLVRHAAFVVLVDQLFEWRAPEEFPKRARAFGLDVRKIVDQVAPAEVQTPAKPEPEKKAKKRGRR